MCPRNVKTLLKKELKMVLKNETKNIKAPGALELENNIIRDDKSSEGVYRLSVCAWGEWGVLKAFCTAKFEIRKKKKKSLTPVAVVHTRDPCTQEGKAEFKVTWLCIQDLSQKCQVWDSCPCFPLLC